MDGEVIKATVRPHSRVSPSMMERVEACTASYFLTPPNLPRDTNTYAAYGSACHELSEMFLKDALLMESDVYGMTIEADGFSYEVDYDMLDMVRPYVEYCRSLVTSKDQLWEVEKSLMLPTAITGDLPEVRGLADFVTVYPTEYADRPARVEIVDLKTGRNTVEADCLQLATYGLMLACHCLSPDQLASDELPIMRTTVVQPAGEGATVRSHDWDRKEMVGLRHRLEALFEDLRHRVFRYQVGSHCDHCPVLGGCAQVRAVAMDSVMAAALPSPDLLASGEFTAADLDDALAKLALLKKFEKALVATADSYLRAGGELENAKLVRKRTNRRWKDGLDPKPLLKKHGVDPYGPAPMISPAQAEKALPASAKGAIGAFIEKPVGDLTVAIGEDSRTAVNVGLALKRAHENAMAQKLLQKAESKQKEAQA
jgi:hypothetical protein